MTRVRRLAEQARVGGSIGPVDCSDNCFRGPCDCSGIFRPVSWNLDPTAVLRALDGDES